MKFTEAQLDSSIIELLGAEGYPHVLGEAIERQPQEVLIKADLRIFLARQYADDIMPQNITLQLKALVEDGEIDLEATCKEYLQVRSEGRRQMKRQVKRAAEATIRKFRTTASAGNSYNLFAIA